MWRGSPDGCLFPVAGGWETQYACCSAAVGATGCQVAKVGLWPARCLLVPARAEVGPGHPELPFSHPSIRLPCPVASEGQDCPQKPLSTARPPATSPALPRVLPARPGPHPHLPFPPHQQHVQDGRKENLEGFVKTFDKELPEDAHPGIYALDCEMVSWLGCTPVPAETPSGPLLLTGAVPAPALKLGASGGFRTKSGLRAGSSRLRPAFLRGVASAAPRRFPAPPAAAQEGLFSLDTHHATHAEPHGPTRTTHAQPHGPVHHVHCAPQPTHTTHAEPHGPTHHAVCVPWPTHYARRAPQLTHHARQTTRPNTHHAC